MTGVTQMQLCNVLRRWHVLCGVCRVAGEVLRDVVCCYDWIVGILKVMILFICSVLRV